MNNDVSVERVGNAIHARIPWDNGNGPILAKKVSGHRWLSEPKVWSYPLAWDTCVALRATFGRRLKIGPQLWHWAEETKAKNERLASLAANPLAEVKLLAVERHAPKLAAALRPYQATGASFVAEGRRVIVADEMRLGKTLEAIAGIIQAYPQGGNFLVFAPKTAVLATWEPEVKRWAGGTAEVVALTGGRSARQARLEYAAEYARGELGSGKPYLFVIANVEMARIKGVKSRMDNKGGEPSYPDLFRIPWDGIVLDESHLALVYTKVSVPKGERGDGPASAPTQTRTGLTRLVHNNPNAMRIALSGTPFRGKLHQLWGTLNWLDPKAYTSYWRWVENYFVVDDNGFGKEIGPIRSESARQAFYAQMAPVMIRRTMREVRSEIPAHIYCGTPLDGDSGPVAIWLPMTPGQAKQYQQLVSDAMVEVDGGEITANNCLAILTRCKQLANSCLAVSDDGDVIPSGESNKIDWILDKVAEGEKMVIASQFTQFLNRLYAALKSSKTLDVKVEMITGEISDKARAAAQRSFQEGDVQIMLLNTKAGGVSLTLDAASIVVVCDETWNADDQAQVEARITPTKTGSDIPAPTVYSLRSRGTIDEGIARSNLMADDIIKAVMDKRRGVSVLRQVISPDKEAQQKSTRNNTKS